MSTVRSIMVCCLFAMSAGLAAAGEAPEVFKESAVEVVVREHPVTGKPFVLIVSTEGGPGTPLFPWSGKPFTRPDYRMLDGNVKRSAVPYDGPVSDRKKVYLLAATLAAGGVTGGAVGFAPASTAGAASAAGGGAAFTASGAGLAAGAVTAAVKVSGGSKGFGQMRQKSEARLLHMNTQSEPPIHKNPSSS